jgi:hypothetical protein
LNELKTQENLLIRDKRRLEANELDNAALEEIKKHLAAIQSVKTITLGGLRFIKHLLFEIKRINRTIMNSSAYKNKYERPNDNRSTNPKQQENKQPQSKPSK